jgi:hypothetical protein
LFRSWFMLTSMCHELGAASMLVRVQWLRESMDE